jgi:hypothetical protein
MLDRSKLLVGGLNAHIPIVFKNGDRWVCRARQQNLSRTADRVIMEHEIATIKMLRTIMPQLIPEVFVPELTLVRVCMCVFVADGFTQLADVTRD